MRRHMGCSTSVCIQTEACIELERGMGVDELALPADSGIMEGALVCLEDVLRLECLLDLWLALGA